MEHEMKKRIGGMKDGKKEQKLRGPDYYLQSLDRGREFGYALSSAYALLVE